MNIQLSIQHRNNQSTVMTTQLIQSLKILQYNQEQIHAFVSEHVERNPFIEYIGDTIQEIEAGDVKRTSSSERRVVDMDADAKVREERVAGRDRQEIRPEERRHRPAKASSSTQRSGGAEA